MFKVIGRSLVFTFFILFFTGCYGGTSVDPGMELEELVVLDGEYEAKVFVEKGESFGIDIRNPVNKGVIVSGASFDPALLRMERYLEYDDDGASRFLYLFTAIVDGTSDVLIKMTSTSGGIEEVFKQVTVSTGGDSGGLF